ncbi:MAG TPA: helix-turn-helix domain-containing protein, partial [Fimbriimonas sp.]|nr:helix-turn-helix domain-containing protein [Fimbriimonas sp.]
MAELFPGQVERIDLTIEQVRVLSSEIRNEVFYSYQKREPRSVAEVANGLGKSAQTVHYHTNELADAGLLIAVEERKVRSRTEKLYVHAALSTNSR